MENFTDLPHNNLPTHNNLHEMQQALWNTQLGNLALLSMIALTILYIAIHREKPESYVQHIADFTFILVQTFILGVMRFLL